jgi:DNA-binding CsgD family transcriptional regulator/tetratricopeptide (TPR) repeat protein
VPRRVTSPEFVGRGPEVAALFEALDRAAAGEFAAVFLGGESGVGKSRLLAELVRAAGERNARVLAGACVSLAEGELPYAPVRSALRALARELEADQLGELLGGGREELARLVPELATANSQNRAPAGRGEPLAQARMFELLSALLARLSEKRPVLLAIEDVHWADRSTLDFLAFLLSSARREPLLLVCTYRTDALYRGHPLRAFLARHARPPSTERIDLEPFTREEVEAQLRGILDKTPDADLIERVHRRTEGNAFFTEELVAAGGDATELPASLRDVLMLRTEALAEPAQAVLRLAAAHGRVVTHRLLAAACDLPESELAAALREAAGDQVLVPWDDESWAFRHALLHETLQADLVPGERASLHLALAEALESDPGLASADSRVAAELYAHWLGAGRLPEALSAAVRAGLEAQDVYAFAEASHHFERALDLWNRVEDAESRAGTDRAELYVRAAKAAHLSGEPARAVEFAQAAIELVDAAADATRAAILRERLGSYLWVNGDVEDALRSYLEAVELMPREPPTPQLARILGAQGQILMLRGRVQESRACCEQAIEIARSIGARSAECHALNTLGVDIATLGDRRRGIAYLLEAKAAAEGLDWIEGIGRAYVNLTEMLDWDARLSESADLTLEGAETMRRLGASRSVIFLGNEATHRLLRLGRLREAAEALATVREVRPSGFAEAIHYAGEAELAAIRGDADGAHDAARRARLGLGGMRDAMYFGPTAAIEVGSHIAAGQPDAATAAFEQALAEVAGEAYVFFVARLYARGVRAYADLAELARARGDGERLAEIEAAATAAIQRFDAMLEPEHFPEGDAPPSSLAHRAVIEGELSRLRGRSDADLWRRAAAAWADLDEPLELGYVQWRGAEALLLAGEARHDATDLLAAVATAAHEIGATDLLTKAQSLAKRARVPLDGAPKDGGQGQGPERRFGLTERELEVLALLAEGMTNREIGERLFMSEKTASVHVSRILAKLDVRGRVEAATMAQRAGIVPLPRS